jgi:hypothetical protein
MNAQLNEVSFKSKKNTLAASLYVKKGAAMSETK